MATTGRVVQAPASGILTRVAILLKCNGIPTAFYFQAVKWLGSVNVLKSLELFNQ
jgi:hypothetical protein